MSLSDNIGWANGIGTLPLESVKTFIKELKEEGHKKCLKNGTIPINDFYNLIDEKAGPEIMLNNYKGGEVKNG